MGDSKIEWTEKTWNPVVGCTKVSPGCAHCYAETMAKRLRAMALKDMAEGRDPGRKRHYIDAVDEKGRWTGKLIPVPEALGDPLGWKKPRMVFVNSMSDLFHESVPFCFVDKVMAVIWECQWHTFQVLTKRPDRMAEYFNEWNWRVGVSHAAWWRLHERDLEKAKLVSPEDIEADLRSVIPGLWLGTSVENQETADKRIPHLLKCPAAVRFLSCEPLLGAVDLRTGIYSIPPDGEPRGTSIEGIDWVIAGGESGHHARPSHPDWFRSLRDQCQAAGVPFFFKQWGEWTETSEFTEGMVVMTVDGSELEHHSQPGAEWLIQKGKKAAGRLLDGVEWSQFPEARV